ncbi:MAG: sigma-70 family RNA polymerase sigma factor [Xanthomonadales bacterium]|nr:sigma-70 family RNA polymerase sigma factor [Xanthomonadales bacterium]
MSDLRTTTQLLERVGTGDNRAQEELMERYLPRLRHWAHGRLPTYGRDLAETDDLVQITLIRAMNHLERFENKRPGAFLAYLRTILMNVVRDEIRRTTRAPDRTSLEETQLASHTSPVEAVVGRDALESYERGLSKLSDEKRLAVVMRVEFDMDYDEIARELERPSVNATRMMVVRAIADLSEAMA